MRTSSHSASDPARPRILVVDDSPFEQRLLADLLKEQGYRVSIAAHGAQGYDLALAGQPDLILLDVRMPNMDGYAACRLLKANPATQAIPVIFLSGATAEAERITGLSIGGVDYVAKPFSPGELKARIEVHLALARRTAAATAAAADPAPAPAPAAPATSQDAVLVLATKRLIEENLATLPGLGEIARSLGTYREKLSLVFREQTGMTVFTFIREQRIARSVALLRDTAIGVQDIALMVGFNNAGNFATAFRERTGVTPSAYRQSMQEQGVVASASR